MAGAVLLAAATPRGAVAEAPVPRASPLTLTLATGLDVATLVAMAPSEPPSMEAAIRREVEADVWLSVARFYEARHHAPIWTGERAATLRARLAQAEFDGLDPADYVVPPAGDGVGAQAAEEVALTEAALRYARHAHAGRTHPSDVSRIMTLEPPSLNERTFLLRLAHARDVAATLDSVHPQHAQYQGLRVALRRTLERSVDAPPAVGRGPNLKEGVRSPRVAVLRARLGATVRRGTDATVFDAALGEAVKGWQRAHGLAADGIVGPRSLAILDAGLGEEAAAALISNMERWRWMPRWLGAHHVVVNVPAYRVRVVSSAETAYEGRVIVGKPANPTPIFSDEVEHVVVNPYWNVPFSIASSEMLGGIQADPTGYLARRGYEAVLNGRVVHPASIAWSRDALRHVRIRQRPGRGNALGSIKFLFPNRHAVYLHDTPTKQLFSRTERAYSHGCVRVEDPFAFADALLAREAGMSGAGLKRLVGRRQQWLDVERKIPVHLTYFTREVAQDGTLLRYADVYGYDARTQRALGL
ncbi:L,D-transpeptidase family protein [Acuticoccus sp.]|uniref:L,D-transpeptidase family protein n=1 Tax=Acuticoccus sp. TaxID=1904378 RepID=UPI003B525EA3